MAMTGNASMAAIEQQWDFDGLDRPGRLLGGISLLLVGLIGLVGNGLVFAVGIRILHYRRNVPNILTLVLCIVDSFNIVLSYSQAVLAYFAGYLGGGTACDVHATFIVLFNYMSMLIVAGMSVDRCLALYKPFCYERHLSYNARTMVVSVAGGSIVAMVLALLPSLGVGRNVLHYPGSYCLFRMSMRDVGSMAMIFTHLTLLVVTATVIVSCNVCVCIMAHRLMTVARPRTLSAVNEAEIKSNASTSSTGQEVQFVKLSVLVVAVFGLCWSVYMVKLLVVIADQRIPPLLDLGAARLASLHSVINPWLLPVIKRRYRESFMVLCRDILSSLTCSLISASGRTLDEIFELRVSSQYNLPPELLTPKPAKKKPAPAIVEHTTLLMPGKDRTGSEMTDILDIERGELQHESINR